MLNKSQKSLLRAELFRHLDGIVVAPIAYCLFDNGVTDFIIEQKKTSLSEITEKFNANDGYLNVALRTLASQGWLGYELNGGEVFISINDKSSVAFEHFYLYEDVVDLMQFSEKFHKRSFAKEPFDKLASIFQKYNNKFNLQLSNDKQTLDIQSQILKHIEGYLVGPTVVLLGMGGMFHKYFMEASFSPEEYHKDPDSFRVILDFLSQLEWFRKTNGHYTFTDKGLFFAKRASAYGVTVSYVPMFRKTKELIFKDANILWQNNDTNVEYHVDREMNVWGSGGAHSAYFKKIDEIVIHLFNQPINLQPKGILDMGCGNGAFLIHLFEVIESQTLRGKHLEEHPLFLVGADYNKAALKVTRSNLIQADIWAKVIWGDIGDPEKLNNDLNDNYTIQLKDLLSVRTFLDHNRIWSEPMSQISTPSESKGAFAFRGKRLNNNDVERNLKDHFIKWQPFIEKFGLIVIELHSLPPELIAKNIGKTAATAYDATHGFSDQYILELESFIKIANEAGLKHTPEYACKFPNSELATVSINYLK